MDNETELFRQRLSEALAPSLRGQGPEAVAKVVYEVVRKFAGDVGMKPDIECDYVEPGAQKHIPAQNGWTVVFEAGPYDWAIEASFLVISRTGVSCEPYYGFDLTFYRE